MTRYQYRHANERSDPAYWVFSRDVCIGWCRRDETGNRVGWLAFLFTDPTTTGKGRTRDDAVDDAYEQVGGPDS